MSTSQKRKQEPLPDGYCWKAVKGEGKKRVWIIVPENLKQLDTSWYKIDKHVLIDCTPCQKWWGVLFCGLNIHQIPTGRLDFWVFLYENLHKQNFNNPGN